MEAFNYDSFDMAHIILILQRKFCKCLKRNNEYLFSFKQLTIIMAHICNKAFHRYKKCDKRVKMGIQIRNKACSSGFV